MLVWTCCEHQTNKQSKNRAESEFSNVEMPIAHHISICFHVDVCFYCCYCAIYLHSTRERRWLFTVLQFYFLLSTTTTLGARSLFSREFIIGFVAVVAIQFFFSDNSISHLTSALTLSKQQHQENMRRFFSFILARKWGAFLHSQFFCLLRFEFNCSKIVYVLPHIARRRPSNVDSIEIQHG